MALPDNYDPWLHLQSQLLSTYNLQVEQNFIGVPADDISTALGGLRQACILQPDDNVAMTNIRMMLYYFTLQGQLPTPVYGIPVTEFQSHNTFLPQIKMFFLEDYNFAENTEKLPRASSEISFRLKNFTSQTINPSQALTLANSIKEFFGGGGGFTWERGTTKVTYLDATKGYDFRLLVSSESEAVRVIQQVLEIQGHSFDETLVNVHQSRKAFPAVPSQIEVYGKSVRDKRKRPTVTVRFRYAQLLIDGLVNSISLYDMTGKRQSLVK